MLLGLWIRSMLLENPFGLMYCILLTLCVWRRSPEMTSELLDQFWKVWVAMGLMSELLILVPWALVQRQWMSPERVPTVILLLVASLVVVGYGGKAFFQRAFPGLFSGIVLVWPLLVLEGGKFGMASLSSFVEYDPVECLLFGFGIAVGWGIRLVMFLAIRHQLHDAPLPNVFKGFGITVLLVILIRMSFMGFAGIV